MELAYPLDHPAHPDNKGKKPRHVMNQLNADYPLNHFARGGQGQAVHCAAGTDEPRDGHKHLHGLPGNTLIERQREFERLPKDEQEARQKWNTDGIPAPPEEGE